MAVYKDPRYGNLLLPDDGSTGQNQIPINPEEILTEELSHQQYEELLYRTIDEKLQQGIPTKQIRSYQPTLGNDGLDTNGQTVEQLLTPHVIFHTGVDMAINDKGLEYMTKISGNPELFIPPDYSSKNLAGNATDYVIDQIMYGNEADTKDITLLKKLGVAQEMLTTVTEEADLTVAGQVIEAINKQIHYGEFEFAHKIKDYFIDEQGLNERTIATKANGTETTAVGSVMNFMIEDFTRAPNALEDIHDKIQIIQHIGEERTTPLAQMVGIMNTNTNEQTTLAGQMAIGYNNEVSHEAKKVMLDFMRSELDINSNTIVQKTPEGNVTLAEYDAHIADEINKQNAHDEIQKDLYKFRSEHILDSDSSLKRGPESPDTSPSPKRPRTDDISNQL